MGSTELSALKVLEDHHEKMRRAAIAPKIRTSERKERITELGELPEGLSAIKSKKQRQLYERLEEEAKRMETKPDVLIQNALARALGSVD